MGYKPPFTDWYIKNDLTPPSSVAHGTEEDIQSKLKPLMPNSWRLEGNQLIGFTEMGKLSQTIPTSHILVGSDEKGYPIFRKVEI